MRILHAGNFNNLRKAELFYCTDKKISLGLCRLGHFVYEYSCRDVARYLSPIKSKKFGVSRMNKHFIQTIEHLEPDLLLFGHSELIAEGTLIYIKKYYPEVKIGMWYVDPL
ncbi:MAG: glycosyltransferase, partial [Candidatus Dadabacteria bacterium]|nr:glycosyltransferase [Candidatus Dadabacteria bacterium]